MGSGDDITRHRRRWFRSGLTGHVLDDPYLLDELHDYAQGDHGPLGLRLRLDHAVRELPGWPDDDEYTRVADDLEGAGWLEHAALLRQASGAGELLEQVRRQWADRYAYRGLTAAELELDRLTESGDLDLADAAPVPGVDGALYERGYITAAPHAGHVVVVRGRGLEELIAFGNDEGACERWLASRGPYASGPLGAPSAAAGSRTAREERVLAAMLTRRHVPELELDTFTADARYDIYAAVRTVSAGSSEWQLWEFVRQVMHGRDRLPPEAAARYGGPGLPWLRGYLDRLILTQVSGTQASADARELTTQDQWFRAGSCEPTVSGGYTAGRPVTAAPRDLPVGQLHRLPGVKDQLLQPRPRQEPGGPAPRL